jgi:poly(A) polymerase
MELVLLQIHMILSSLNATTYIVGGAVRDKLLGLKVKDIDLVTDADYDSMSVAFATAGWQIKQVGKQYLVLHISKQGYNFEISNFRNDTDNTGGRIGNITSDAARRDFYINALYTTLDYSEIIDPTNKGLQDIKARRLRFIGRAEDRIKEDPLRALRFYRLLKTKHLVPHPGSLRAVRKCFKSALPATSPERVRAEIERIIFE